MSVSAVKAGEAYVSIVLRDQGVDAGAQRLQSRVRTMLRVMERDTITSQKIVGTATTQQANQLETSLRNSHQVVHQQITGLMDLLKAKRQTGIADAEQRDLMQQIRGMIEHRRTLESQINAVAVQRALISSQELAATQAVTQQLHQQEIAAQRVAAAEREALAAQQQAAADTRTGKGLASQAMTQGTQYAAISGMAKPAEADRMLSTLNAQRATINAQVQSSMHLLRTIREQGAAQAQQQPLMQQIRDLIEQRRGLEAQINAVTAQRLQLQNNEVIAARNLATQQAQGMAAFNKQSGLSQATMQKFKGSILSGSGAMGKFGGALRAGSSAMGRFGAMGGQVAFLADDLVAGYHLGGVAGAIRVSTNNLVFMTSMFHPYLAIGTVAASIAAQLAISYYSKAKAAKEAGESIKAAGDHVKAYTDRLKENLEAQRAFKDIKLTFEDDELRSQLRDTKKELEDHNVDLAKLFATRNSLQMQKARGEKVDDGELSDAHLAVIEGLKRRESLEQRISEIIAKRKRLNEYEDQRNRRIDSERKKHRDREEKQKGNRQAAATAQTGQQFDQLLVAEIDGLRDKLEASLDPHGFKVKQIYREREERLQLANLLPQDEAMQMRQMINQDADKKIKAADAERLGPISAMRKEMDKSANPMAAQIREVNEQAAKRLKAIDDAKLAPKERAEMQLKVMMDREKSIKALQQTERKDPAVMLANSTEGIKAIINATSGQKSKDQQLLHTLMKVAKTEEDMVKWLEINSKSLQGAFLIKAEDAT